MPTKTTPTTRRLQSLRLTVPEAAAYIGMSPKFVRDRLEDGTLPYYKMGAKSVRIDVAVLDAYLLASRVEVSR